MKSRRQAPFVVTVSVLGLGGGALGCEHPRVRDQPRPEPLPTVETAAVGIEPATAITEPTASTSASPPRHADFKRELNERDENHQQIFVGGESGCFIYSKWPEDKPRAPGMMPPPIAMACPPSMTDSAWRACVSGTLSTNDGGTECSCFIGGNPPPPPRLVTCPASAKR